jgi:hypothetical protein
VDFNPGPDSETRTADGGSDAFLLQLYPNGEW